jgi:hypothetical protein
MGLFPQAYEGVRQTLGPGCDLNGDKDFKHRDDCVCVLSAEIDRFP